MHIHLSLTHTHQFLLTKMQRLFTSIFANQKQGCEFDFKRLWRNDLYRVCRLSVKLSGTYDEQRNFLGKDGEQCKHTCSTSACFPWQCLHVGMPSLAFSSTGLSELLQYRGRLLLLPLLQLCGSLRPLKFFTLLSRQKRNPG